MNDPIGRPDMVTTDFAIDQINGKPLPDYWELKDAYLESFLNKSTPHLQRYRAAAQRRLPIHIRERNWQAATAAQAEIDACASLLKLRKDHP